MKTRPGSLIQLKSGRDSHCVSEFGNFFVTLPGLNTGIKSLIMHVSLQNDSFGTSAYRLNSPSSSTEFFISLFSYIHALLQYIRAVHSLLR